MKTSQTKVLLIITAFVTSVTISTNISLSMQGSKDEFSRNIHELAQKISNKISKHETIKNIAVLTISKDQAVLEKISPSVSDQIIASLQKSRRNFNIFDSSNTQKILEELQLSASGRDDPEYSLKIGLMIGADVIVTTRVTAKDDKVYISLRAIEVSTANLLAIASTVVPMTSIQAAEAIKKRTETEGEPENSFSWIFDKLITFFIQNWPWLWTIVFVPIAGWTIRRFRKKSKPSGT